MLMNGKVVIITGAGAGLGREHALLFASHGAKVVVNDPGHAVTGVDGDARVADQVVEEIRKAGGEAVANHDSVSTKEGAQRIVEAAINQWGRIDTLVNNAGILRDKSFVKTEMADFETVLQVHLMGSVYCTRAAWPMMMEQKFGRIVMTTSIAGTSGNFGQASYAASKMGMLGLMNTLAIEGAKNNIKINAVSPGGMTRMTQDLGNLDAVTARGRYLKPSLVSPAVVWMGSELCNVSAHIFSAAAGGFGRVHFFETEGVQFNPEEPVTVDMFGAAVERICDLTTATPTVLGLQSSRVSKRLAGIGITL